MKTIRCLFLLLTGSFASLVCAQEKPAPLAPEQKAYLASYESVRAALAADDLAAATKAAAELLKVSPKPTTDKPDVTVLAVQKIANATSIEAARGAFKTVSKEALRLADGQPGYFHAHCPMVPKDQGDWVQTSKKINNPYFGKSMLTCGSIE
jgi:hypothetical protein